MSEETLHVDVDEGYRVRVYGKVVNFDKHVEHFDGFKFISSGDKVYRHYMRYITEGIVDMSLDSKYTERLIHTSTRFINELCREMGLDIYDGMFLSNCILFKIIDHPAEFFYVEVVR
jgi:hypothetical protein